MAKKGGHVVLQEEINNDEDWEKMLEKPGVYVVDIYTELCGPCVPMIGNLKKVKMDLNVNTLHYAIAISDKITALKRFRGRSEPHWMFFYDGKMVNLYIGVDAPKLTKLITNEVNQYHMYKKGQIQREFIPIYKITDVERKSMAETEYYLETQMKIENKIKDQKMMKVREHALRQFFWNIPLKTCIVFFPHTIQYIMVEKARPENADENSSEPVMVEKRVCEVANLCALRYEELTVVEAKEIELTEDALNEIFFFDHDILESFPPSLREQLLTKKIYSVMLSFSETESDTENANNYLSESDNIMGVIEQKACEIIYGDGNPLDPSPNSIAFISMTVDEFGYTIPAVYTPTNPLSKASAFTVLFKKFCANHGYVVPEPPLPQYLIKFDVNKSIAVVPTIKDLKDKIIQYGFFSNANSETPKLLSKDFDLLTMYNLDNIGKDVMLVLSVMWDNEDKNLLRFASFEPAYMSPNYKVGINDSDKYFPYDYDQMEGELNMPLESDEGEMEYLTENYFNEEEQENISQQSSN